MGRRDVDREKVVLQWYGQVASSSVLQTVGSIIIGGGSFTCDLAIVFGDCRLGAFQL